MSGHVTSARRAIVAIKFELAAIRLPASATFST